MSEVEEAVTSFHADVHAYVNTLTLSECVHGAGVLIAGLEEAAGKREVVSSPLFGLNVACQAEVIRLLLGRIVHSHDLGPMPPTSFFESFFEMVQCRLDVIASAVGAQR